jgi:hypothetical protein
MPLRKRVKPPADTNGVGGKGEVKKKSKRQRIADLFRSKKHKPEEKAEKVCPTLPYPKIVPEATTYVLMIAFLSKVPIATKQSAPPPKPARDSKIAESTKPAKSNSSVEVARVSADRDLKTQFPSPPPEEDHKLAQIQEKEKAKKKAKAEILSEDHVHTIFSGAPHFEVEQISDYSIPKASFPWDFELKVRDVSDSVQLAQPAFSAATLRRHLPNIPQPPDQDKQYLSYDPEVIEIPSMLSAQGIEPGTCGFVHFLELPTSDTLMTDLQQSQSSNGYLEAVRNKEQMQTNPERLGIRRVDMEMVHDRLIEFGDLLEVFQDSPQRMTILNNQSSGDLYANLFGKFLTPPAYDDSADDPTGLKVQINQLLKILRLKGVWHDFSLVEWRIRLGQILWGDDGLDEVQHQQLWSEREILLLQITLACELLLRLDAVSSMDADDIKAQMHVTREDFEGFLDLKSRKINWDLVLARRFLDNIMVMKGTDAEVQTPKSRGLLSMLSRDESHNSSLSAPDIVLLPRHQARQLSGLVHFAETIQWPGFDLVFKAMAQRLQVPEIPQQAPEQSLTPHAYGKLLDPSTPSSISVYGTPLASPASPSNIRDSYFGHLSKPALSRSNSKSLKLPLSDGLASHAQGAPAQLVDIGGWLSRSYLTGLVLPGEALSHFLMSTLLENDKLAIAALGDSANLYGGFIYAERSWWSKSCIVGRALACTEGSVECMGWVSLSKLPADLIDGWFAISSEQLAPEQHPRIKAEKDLLARDSIFIPDDASLRPEDLTLPTDSSTPPIPSVEFTEWNLTALNPDLLDNDGSSDSPSESETHFASLTFTSVGRGTAHTLTLTYDIQYITSFPCTPPAKSEAPSPPQITRTSSKRSIHSMKSGTQRSGLARHPSRRNSHGFEPLFSHPPDSPGMGPTRVHSPVPDDETEENNVAMEKKSEPMSAHPLHVSYKYKIVPVTEILDPNFNIPFKISTYASPAHSNPESPSEELHSTQETTILVLDARNSRDLELLARTWCAEKGLHAIIGRVGRSCLACCIREARGIGINVVIRI